MSYRNSMIDGFCETMNKRFQLTERPIVNANRILNFKKWPYVDSDELQDFGVDDMRALCSHYEKTLKKFEFDTDEALNEWRIMKIVLHKRNGTELPTKSWDEVYDSSGDFRNINHINDLLLTLPPTSVSCETTFSQMKLVKTSRRTRLSTSTLNTLLLVKLGSPPVEKYDPKAVIDKWMASAVKRRRTDYQQKPKKAHVDLVDEEPEVVIDMAPEEAVEADSAADAPGSEEGELELDVEFLNSICDDEEDYCWDFQDEETNLINIMSFSRSS